MKKISSIIIALLALNSLAQEEMNTNKVVPNIDEQDESTSQVTSPKMSKKRLATDLITFPNAGEIIAGISYSSTSIESKWTYLLKDYSNTETTSTAIDYTVGYAINDYLALKLTTEQVLSEKQEVTYGPATTSNGEKATYESEGFGDPTYSLIYRAFDTSKNSYDMNLFIDISPEFEDAKDASKTVKGNNTRGGRELSFGVEWGRKISGYSWSVGLELESNGEAKSKNASSGSITTVDSYGTFNITSNFQWEVNPKFTFGINLALGSTGEIKVKYADGTTLSYEDGRILGLGATANVTLQENVYLSFSLMGLAVSDRNVIDEQNVVVIDQDRSGGVFSMGILMQF